MHCWAQGVLFKGKMLGNEDSLSDAGVSDGDNLLIVPKTGFSRPRPAASGVRVHLDRQAATETGLGKMYFVNSCCAACASLRRLASCGVLCMSPLINHHHCLVNVLVNADGCTTIR